MAKKKQDETPIEIVKETYERSLREAVDVRMGDLKGTIDAALENATTEILSQAIGIRRSSWDRRKWEVDHCNGRKTAILNELGDYAMEKVKAAIPDFIEKLATKPTALTTALRDEYQRAYNRHLLAALRETAERRAIEDAERLLNEILPRASDKR
jgi:hypothetical protein